MKIIKKLMQIALAVFFFGLLATSAVLADDADSEGWQFVQENGRTYYKKGDLKETYWRVIDGKYYYFDPLSGEMVVGWQYIPFPSKGSTIGPYPNGIRLEGFPKSEWYYFDKNGGAMQYSKAAFGDFVGFNVGILGWAVTVIAWAAMLAGFAKIFIAASSVSSPLLPGAVLASMKYFLMLRNAWVRTLSLAFIAAMMSVLI